MNAPVDLVGLQGSAALSRDGGHRRAAVLSAARQPGARLSARRRRARPVRPRRGWPRSAPWLDALRHPMSRRSTASPRSASSFLLFMIGLELSFERLTRMRRLVFGLGLRAGRAVGGCCSGRARSGSASRRASALVIGAALSLSSTAIVIPVLAERKRLNLAAGRASFAVLLFQDLAVAPLLFMVTMLVGGRESGLGFGLALTLAPAALALTGADRARAAGAAAAVPFRRHDEEHRILHGRLPAGGPRRRADRRGERPVDGARRLHRRAAAGRDRIPPRDRGDDRAVQGPAARRCSSSRSAPGSICRCSSPRRRRSSSPRRGVDRDQGARAAAARARLPRCRGAGAARGGAAARPGRRIRLRHDRRRRWPGASSTPRSARRCSSP